MSITRDPTSVPAGGQRQAPPVAVWRRLLVVAAGAGVLTFLLAALTLGDLEAAAYAVGYAVGLALLRLRKPVVGLLVMAVLSVNVLAWMVLGVASNLRSGQGVLAVAVPALVGCLALVVAVAAGADLARRCRPGGSRKAARAVAGAAGLALVAAVGASVVTGDGGPGGGDGSLSVTADNVLFAPDRLEAEAGEVTVSLANRDLFWHTLTIDELGVDLPVAVHGKRAVTFAANAGTYTFYCRIPGHEARMRGTLVVR